MEPVENDEVLGNLKPLNDTQREVMNQLLADPDFEESNSYPCSILDPSFLENCIEVDDIIEFSEEQAMEADDPTCLEKQEKRNAYSSTEFKNKMEEGNSLPVENAEVSGSPKRLENKPEEMAVGNIIIQKTGEGELSDGEMENDSGKAKKLPISTLGKAPCSQGIVEANKNDETSPFQEQAMEADDPTCLEKQEKRNAYSSTEFKQQQDMEADDCSDSEKKNITEIDSANNPTCLEKQDKVNVDNSTEFNQNMANDVNDGKLFSRPTETDLTENDSTTHDLSVQNKEPPKEEIRNQDSSSHNSRGLINQSLSLPYYNISRPDFHEFTCNAAKNLEVPMKTSEKDDDEVVIVKDLFIPDEDERAFSRLKQLEKKLEKDEIIVLWESPVKPQPSSSNNQATCSCNNLATCSSNNQATSSSNNQATSSSNNQATSCSNYQAIYKSCRENLMKILKDQMQKKKEAAFDKHKKIVQADEEIYISDSDEYETINNYSPCSPYISSDSNSRESYKIDSQMEKQASESISTSAGIKMKHDDAESFRDSQPVSLSLPSYQPGGGFIDQHDASKDSYSSGIIEAVTAPAIQRPCITEFAVINNDLNLDASQSVNDVSTICSGNFSNVDDRAWSPTSNSQMNQKIESDVESNIDDNKNMNSDNENMDAEETRTDVYDVKSDNDSKTERSTKRKRDDSILSPPSKKYQSAAIQEENVTLLPLKINKIFSMNDAYGKSLFSGDNTTAEQINEEEFEDDELEEQEFAPHVKRCKPLLDSDDDEEEEQLLNNPHLNESSSQNQVDVNISYPNKINDFFDEEAQLSGEEMSSDEDEDDETELEQVPDDVPENEAELKEQVANIHFNDFFDEEAQLSGEEMSSDESEEDEDDETELEQVPDDVPENEAELKEQVANIHFKHEQDNDARMVKQLQLDFLPEGELHVDGSGRQKRFHWSNDDSNVQNEILSESEPEDDVDTSIHQDKMKWRQETSEIQKTGESESSDGEIENGAGKAKKLPISILGKAPCSQGIVEANKNDETSPFARRHGSLINVAGSDGLHLNSSSFQRKSVLFKKNGSDTEG